MDLSHAPNPQEADSLSAHHSWGKRGGFGDSETLREMQDEWNSSMPELAESFQEQSSRDSCQSSTITKSSIDIESQETETCSAEDECSTESSVSLAQRFRDKFGKEGRVQVQVLQRFGSFPHAHVKINGDSVSLHGEDITSFVEFPMHANELLSNSWSEDLRYFVVCVNGFMTMVELVPAAPQEPKIARELNLIHHTGMIAALQAAKRRGDFEFNPDMLIELVHRTRQFTKPFLRASLTLERFLAVQKLLGVPYFEHPSVSDKSAEAIVDEYEDALVAPCRSARFWNRAGLIEAIAFMDFECALKCFEAGMKVAEDDATEAMLCANWGQVSGESIVANFSLPGSCTKKTLMYLNRASTLDPRLVDPDYGFPLLQYPWRLYTDDTLDCLLEQEEAALDTNLDGLD